MSITQTIPLYSGNVPNRSSGAGTFSDDADAWIAYQAPLAAAFNTYAGQVNNTRNQINSRANQVAQDTVLAQSAGQAATSIANFKGAWSGLAGALNVPSSVLHRGNYWALLSNTSNVQNIEPGVSSQWSLVPVAGYNAFMERINSKSTLIADFVRNQHRVYEQYGLTDKAITDVLDTTRASTATYDSPFGVATAAVDEPRITYDPETGACLGLLSEESRTNQHTHSNDFTNAGWEKSSNATVTTKTDTTSPISSISTNVFQLNSNDDNRAFVRQFNSIVTGNVYTISRYVRYISGNESYNILLSSDRFIEHGGLVEFTMSGGVVTSSVPAISKIQKHPNGWYRISVTATAAVTEAAQVQHHVSNYPAAAVNSNAGAQFEAGSSPTSYIPTGASAVTRDADNNTIPIVGGAVAGTIAFKDIDFNPSEDASQLLMTVRLNNDNEFQLRSFGSPDDIRIRVRVDSIFTNLITNIDIAELKSIVMSWQRTAIGYRFKAVTNLNALVTVDVTTANDIDFNVLGILQRGNNSLHSNGTVGEIYMSPRMLPDSELTALLGGN